MAEAVGVLSQSQRAGQEGCEAPSLSASDLSFSIQFIIDEKIFVVLFPPAMKETGFALAISRICSKLEGFQSTAGNGVYGESSCSGALLAMVDTALEHRDRHIAAAFDLSPHSKPFTAARRPDKKVVGINTNAGATSYCTEGEGLSHWEAGEALREAECLLGWKFANSIPLEEGVVCTYFCDTSA